MKKEFLESLGLTAEQIKSVQEESGKDIEKHKQEAVTVKAELTRLQGLISERDKDIETLKSSAKDVDGLQKQLEEVQSKYKAETEQYQKAIAERDYNGAVDNLFSSYKFASDLAKKGAITEFKAKGFKLDEGKLVGGKEWVEELVKAQPSAFVSDEKKPAFSDSTQGSATINAGSITKEAFKGMGYSDRVKLKSDNPEMYNKLITE